MSLFRNRNKKFEEELRRQLGESEVKPSGSLWDKLDQELADGFEQKVQGKLDNFETVPYPHTWERIEAELPAEPVSRPWLRYTGISLLALLFASGIYIGYQMNKVPAGIEVIAQEPQPAPEIHSSNASATHVEPAADSAPVENTVQSALSSQADPAAAASAPENVHSSTVASSKEDPAAASADPARPPAQPARNATASHPANNTADLPALAANRGQGFVHTNEVASRKPVVADNNIHKAIASPQAGASTADSPSGNNKAAVQASETLAAVDPASQTGEQLTEKGNGIASVQDKATAQASPSSKGIANEQQTDLTTANSQPALTQHADNTTAGAAAAGMGNGAPAQQPANAGRRPAAASANPASGSPAKGNEPAGNAAANTTITAPATTDNAAAPVQEARSVAPIASGSDTAHALSSSNTNPNKEELSKLSFFIMAGVQLSYNHLSAPSSSQVDLSKNIELRRQVEKTNIDWSGGFLAELMLSDRLRISSGVMMLNFSQSFTFNTTTPAGAHGSNERGAVIEHSNDSIVAGGSNSSRIRYTWTEIPLLLSYRVTNNPRWNFEVQGGVSYGMISSVDASMISYDNTGILVLKDKDAFPGVRDNLFVMLHPMLTYSVDERLSLGIMPTFKYSTTSIIRNPDWVQQHPYFLGLSVALRRRF